MSHPGVRFHEASPRPDRSVTLSLPEAGEVIPVDVCSKPATQIVKQAVYFQTQFAEDGLHFFLPTGTESARILRYYASLILDAMSHEDVIKR